MYATLSGGATTPLITSSNIWYYKINPARMIYNIHNENKLKTVSATYMYVQCRYLTNNPTTLFLKTKYLKYNKISFKFRAITQFIMCSIESMANSTYKHPKITFVLQWIHRKKLIYWSEHTHTRPGWRPKSYALHSLQPHLFHPSHLRCRPLARSHYVSLHTCNTNNSTRITVTATTTST